MDMEKEVGAMRSRSSWRGGLLAFVAGAVLLLSACGADAEPLTSSSPTTSVAETFDVEETTSAPSDAEETTAAPEPKPDPPKPAGCDVEITSPLTDVPRVVFTNVEAGPAMKVVGYEVEATPILTENQVEKLNAEQESEALKERGDPLIEPGFIDQIDIPLPHGFWKLRAYINILPVPEEGEQAKTVDEAQEIYCRTISGETVTSR